ncbi:MAG TPA: hypothetical protein VM889_09315 [Candidatus Thermoplasmatota archaeon]|nr:hypothetical protein [Candidatus Thermoplasmatota archaeon]
MRASLLVSAGAAVLLVATLAHVAVAFEPEAPRLSLPDADAPRPPSKPAKLADAEVLERLTQLSGLDAGYITHATFEFERARRVSWTLEGVVLQRGLPMEVTAVATFDDQGQTRFSVSKTGAGALPKDAPPAAKVVEILARAAAPPSLVEAAGPGDRILMVYDHARGPPYTAIEVPAYSIVTGELAAISADEAQAPVLRLVALQDRGLHGYHGEERAIVSLGTG